MVKVSFSLVELVHFPFHRLSQPSQRAVTNELSMRNNFSLASTGNKFVITPTLGKYPIYNHHALGPSARGLGDYKCDISLAEVL